MKKATCQYLKEQVQRYCIGQNIPYKKEYYRRAKKNYIEDHK